MQHTESLKGVIGELLSSGDAMNVQTALRQAVLLLGVPGILGDDGPGLAHAVSFGHQLQLDKMVDKQLKESLYGPKEQHKFHILPIQRLNQIVDGMEIPQANLADDILSQFKVPQVPIKKVLPIPKPKSEIAEEDSSKRPSNTPFMSARKKLRIDDAKNGVHDRNLEKKGKRKPQLGNKGFTRQSGSDDSVPSYIKKGLEDMSGESNGQEEIPEELRGLDPKLVEMINNEIMNSDLKVHWDDIAGLSDAKRCVREIVVWPMLRPDLFKGLRGPPKGILLFGPPGTGKTMIGKAVASECKATFFSISASSLTSKWHGEGEKLVRTLFAVAHLHKPAVIFVDEIDSLLSQRSSSEYEGSRRLKTEFLIQLDGTHTSEDDRVVLIGATNRPQELDEAARRRLVKRLYIPLPSIEGRNQLLCNLLAKETHSLNESQLRLICEKTNGYSGADLKALATEAAFGPIRELTFNDTIDIDKIEANTVRPISIKDFEAALVQVRPSVSPSDLEQYLDWNATFGSFPIV